MSVAMRINNGLQHAVSLGTIETSSKPPGPNHHADRSYDSEDENMSRRRLRHTSSTELYPRPSVYSKGDIREQYCLTDRQLNTVERSRRDRFFGCLSRRSSPQSLLGVCVGRRVPSDENLAAYAPFYRPPRYPVHQYARPVDGPAPHLDLESSYFRRQPASILSSAKSADPSASVDGRQSWIEAQTFYNNENLNYFNEPSSYHCPTHVGVARGLPSMGPPTPRPKHVSFARSHTLTSFDDLNAGFRSSGRLKSAQSQERLIGGKKLVGPPHAYYDVLQYPAQVPQNVGAMGSSAPSIHRLVPAHQHGLPHQPHQSLQPLQPLVHAHPVRLHQIVPDYGAELEAQVQAQQAPAAAATTILPPPSPEVIVVEKKFRNAMKTQATQTDARKLEVQQSLALSPRTVHRVRVVSQGAQTNGFPNGKSLAKSLSEMATGKAKGADRPPESQVTDHESLHRTQSEEPPRSPLESNISYYQPPPPPPLQLDSDWDLGLYCRPGAQQPPLRRDEPSEYDPIAYESNSLPRRTCGHHRVESEFNSLPRRDTHHVQDVCKHITECSELLADACSNDFVSDLLPPPREYCRNDDDDDDDDDNEDEDEDNEDDNDNNNDNDHDYDNNNDFDNDDDPSDVTSTPAPVQTQPQAQPCPKEYRESSRRKSMVLPLEPEDGAPFRRDDVRRQSMPIYVKTEKLLDFGYTRKGARRFPRTPVRDSSDEKEIFIDFKPHVAPTLPPNTHKYAFKTAAEAEPQEAAARDAQCESSQSSEAGAVDSDRSDKSDRSDHPDPDDPLYENVQGCLCHVPDVRETESGGNSGGHCSLPSEGAALVGDQGLSAPPSPCRDGLMADTSTYPSSDSLANDLTRDHSDGHWNESEVTVLTAEQRSEASYNSNLLLTPSARRRNLLLQHQQRSSVDTDALDLEEQLTDQSLTSAAKPKSPVAPHKDWDAEGAKAFAAAPPKPVSPSIEITPSAVPRREAARVPPTSASPAPSPRELRRNVPGTPQREQRRVSEASIGHWAPADNSECSTNTNTNTNTNTDEYATCTDSSRRTPGMRTTLTTATSSSSTTQVPVSTQSSQLERTHGESSFESASSLYSTRGEGGSEDRHQHQDQLSLTPKSGSDRDRAAKKSPAHSISSTSSGSYNVDGRPPPGPAPDGNQQPSASAGKPLAEPGQQRDQVKVNTRSLSDEEHSERRYSSSGYYESPHDDDDDDEERLELRSRRCRQEEDRRRRKTSMKIDIQKENMRALTSPVRREQAAPRKSPDPQKTSPLAEATSPNRLKRFRPKIRRQLRRSIRDDSAPRPRKNALHGAGQGGREKLLDASGAEPQKSAPSPAVPAATSQTTEAKEARTTSKTTSKTTACLSPTAVKSASESGQLKAKSVESLRSVSPGSDSVFYSEASASAAAGEPHGLCLHCTKGLGGEGQGGGLCGDSAESLPFIDTEPDIVRPPSDFADSPVTNKASQRLYKKVDKRFRSEERYQAERGRHYKSRKDTTRAKSEERNQESGNSTRDSLRPAGSSPCILPDLGGEHKQQVIYVGHYDCSRYARLTDSDIWAQLDHQSLERHRGRRCSTESERSFYSKYQVILHRLVQRRCTLEMYRRQKNDVFRVDKTIVVKSDSGEFGFRIHGSKPVVVAAIEPDTPAESSGLEVGDIIIAVNGVQVLDKHHTEVVKIAHDGCERLELQVARTIGVLMGEQQDPPVQPVHSGLLWRQSGQARGSPNTRKWVQRWFVLRSDNCLYYYKTEDDSQPVGAMIMAKHSVERCSPKIGKPFAFKIDAGEGVPMYVAADSEETASRWLGVLRKAAAQENSWLDKSARNLYKQPASIVRPECFGYLMKLGSKWCGWSRRYCVLKDACLFFFQDATSKSALGMVCLHGYKVSSMPTGATGKKNSFEVVPPEPKLRHYYFCAESEIEKKRWISALEYSIDRWIKSG